MRNAVVWPSLTSLRWAERFMMMMTPRLDGAQFRLALLFSSWTAHPAANINIMMGDSCGNKKQKKEYTFAWPVMYSSRAPVVCLFIIDTNVRARERTNGRTDNSVAATCVFIVAMATPHRSNQPNQIDYSPLSFGRSVGASTFDHIT